MTLPCLPLVVSALLAAGPGPGSASPAEPEGAAAEKKRREGFWTERSLNVGASTLGLFNYQFVGQQDGFAFQAGALSDGRLVLGYGGHEWISQYKTNQSFSATPDPSTPFTLPLFSKTADELTTSTEYRYRFAAVPWVGPLANAQAQLQLFPSWARFSEPRRVVRTQLDGGQREAVFGANTPIVFTGWLEPLVLSETVGAYFEPPGVEPWLTSSFKLVGAAQHVLAFGGYRMADDEATPALELEQIPTTHSIGPQAEGNLSGRVLDRVGWSLSSTLYYPVLALGSDVPNVSLLERVHLDLESTLSVKLAQWLSLDAVARLRRQPFVLNDWQVQTSLLLTAGFDLF